MYVSLILGGLVKIWWEIKVLPYKQAFDYRQAGIMIIIPLFADG